jgi:S-adenosylmethionine:tRNA ribosyltransferase-isomerase
MLVRDFHYDLPEELIAQQPLADRAASRLLHLDRASGKLADRMFRDFPALLRPTDLLVFNDTRVFPARLYGTRSGAHSQPVSPNNPASKDFLKGRVEVLLVKQTASGTWQALVRPGRKIGVGEKLSFGEGDDRLHAQVIARGEFGERTLRFEPIADSNVDSNRGDNDTNFFAALDRIGHIPLPPYIARNDVAADRERYQTVYARERGSVAAPTAGLHFTPEIIEQLLSRGIEMAKITLHVGLGTFQPIHAERVENHKLHTEFYSISPEAAAAINTALAAKRRVVAVGTTTVRTLEFVARKNDGKILAGSGEADIFIYPGPQGERVDFRAVGAMLTNFHLPESTLLMLVSAFAGRDQTLAAYQHAVREKYRFYSYGDCMFIE